MKKERTVLRSLSLSPLSLCIVDVDDVWKYILNLSKTPNVFNKKQNQLSLWFLKDGIDNSNLARLFNITMALKIGTEGFPHVQCTLNGFSE